MKILCDSLGGLQVIPWYTHTQINDFHSIGIKAQFKLITFGYCKGHLKVISAIFTRKLKQAL